MELRMDFGRLWRKRNTDFMREIRPYLGYALQTVSLALILLMLAGTYFYTRFLSHVTPDYPLTPISAAVIWPFLAWSPIRTYLKDADLLYLLPLETELSFYMQKAVRRSFWLQSFVLLAVWMILWPMYALAAGSDAYRFVFILALLLVVKRVLLLGRWKELQLTERLPSLVWSIFRWIMAGGFAYALMNFSVGTSTLFVSAGALLYMGMQRFMGRRSLNWQGLLDAEKKQRSSILRLLNLFVDVPGIHSKPRARHAPTKLLHTLGGIHFDAGSAYAFLYSRIWLRSEWFGITLRLTLIGALLIAFSSGLLLPGALFILFAGLTAVQLKELQQMYRHSDWSYIYPLPPALQRRSAQRVCLRIHLLSMAVLCVPALWALPNPLFAVALFAAGGVLSALYHSKRPTKK